MQNARAHEARLQITGKLVVAFIALVGLAVGLFGLLAGVSQNRVYREIAARERKRGAEDVRERGLTLARRLTTAVAPAIAGHDYGLAREVVESTARDERLAPCGGDSYTDRG